MYSKISGNSISPQERASLNDKIAQEVARINNKIFNCLPRSWSKRIAQHTVSDMSFPERTTSPIQRTLITLGEYITAVYGTPIKSG